MKIKKIVIQDFKLINARYKLTSLEIKFILAAISKINNKSDDFKDFEISVSELESLGIGNNSHSRLKQFTKRLMSKPLLIEQDNGDFEVFNWFSRIKYINNSSKFLVRFDNDLKPYLLELKKRFVKYNLEYILPLKSVYSIRIYQLIKEYQKYEKRYFDLNTLYEILQVPKSFTTYNRFKEKVLRVAEKELIEHCDIFFEFEEIKEGKKVVKLLFRIKNNPSKAQKLLKNQKKISTNTKSLTDALFDEIRRLFKNKTKIYLEGKEFRLKDYKVENGFYVVKCFSKKFGGATIKTRCKSLDCLKSFISEHMKRNDFDSYI